MTVVPNIFSKNRFVGKIVPHCDILSRKTGNEVASFLPHPHLASFTMAELETEMYTINLGLLCCSLLWNLLPIYNKCQKETLVVTKSKKGDIRQSFIEVIPKLESP